MTRIPYTTRYRQRPPTGMVGFTLIELMVTLSVAAILLAIAVPSFKYVSVSGRLTTTANELVSALAYTRSEAVKTNNNVDVGANGSVSITKGSPATTTTLRDAIKIPNGIVYGSAQSLVATPTGLLMKTAADTAGYSGLVADISSNQISSNNHRCVYVATGVVVSSCTDSVPCGGTTANASCK